MQGVGGDLRPADSSKSLQKDIADVQKKDPIDASGKKSKSEKVDTEKQQFARSLQASDIPKHLLVLQKPVTAENKQLLMTMLQHGVEASAEAFDTIEKAIKGKGKGNALESAVIAYAKGLEGNSKANSLISEFLSNQLNMSKLLKKNTDSLAKFQSALMKSADFLDPSLIAGMTGFLDDYLDELKKLQKAKDNRDVKTMLGKQSGLMQDLKYLQEFLRGLDSKLVNSNKLSAEKLSRSIKDLFQGVSEFYDALLTQIVMSKNPINTEIAKEFFHYWVIPNPLAVKEKDLEILISKDPKKKKHIDIENNKIVIRCDTDDLGNLTIVCEINQKKMHVKFYSNKEITQKFVLDYSGEFKKSMETLNMEVTGMQSLKKIDSIKKILLPLFDLDQIKRISTEV